MARVFPIERFSLPKPINKLLLCERPNHLVTGHRYREKELLRFINILKGIARE